MAAPVLGPVADDDLYRVSFLQRLFGQRVLNVLYYKVTDIPVPPLPDRWDYMASLADYMTGALKIQVLMTNCQSEDISHEFIRVNRITMVPGATMPYFELAAPAEGVISSAAGTSNTAVSIEKRGTFAPFHPEQGIGRLQLGGIPQNGYANGLLTNDYAALVQPLADEMTEPIVTAGVTAIPVLFGWDNDTDGHINPIFGTSVKRTIRIMRRRTVGVGE